MQLMIAETSANLYFCMRSNPESEPTCWSLIIEQSFFARDIISVNVYKHKCTELQCNLGWCYDGYFINVCPYLGY